MYYKKDSCCQSIDLYVGNLHIGVIYREENGMWVAELLIPNNFYTYRKMFANKDKASKDLEKAAQRAIEELEYAYYSKQ